MKDFPLGIPKADRLRHCGPPCIRGVVLEIL
jgi:hypothetical protein